MNFQKPVNHEILVDLQGNTELFGSPFCNQLAACISLGPVQLCFMFLYGLHRGPSTISVDSKQVSYGIHEALKASWGHLHLFGLFPGSQIILQVYIKEVSQFNGTDGTCHMTISYAPFSNAFLGLLLMILPPCNINSL